MSPTLILVAILAPIFANGDSTTWPTSTGPTTTTTAPQGPCDFTDTLTGRDIIDRGVVERSANCLDSFLEVRLTPNPVHQSASIILQISDIEGILYSFVDGDILDDPDLPSFAIRGPTVYFQGSGAWDATVTLREVPRVECGDRDFPLLGNSTAEVPGDCMGEVATNSRWHFDFQGSERIQYFDLDFSLGHPSDAFLSIRNPNGRLAIVTGHSFQLTETKLAVATELGQAAVDVVVQNTLRDTSDYYANINSFAGEGLMTTTTSTTDVTFEASEDQVPVFSLIVDETSYYQDEQGMLLLQDKIVSLAKNALAPEQCFVFSVARTCRERCSLTSTKDRGCVYFYVDVISPRTCAYSNDELRADLTDELLEEWADDVGAGRIKVDECLENVETEWLVIVVAMPIFVVVVLTVGYFWSEIKNKVQFYRRRRRAQSHDSSGHSSRRATKEQMMKGASLRNPPFADAVAGGVGMGLDSNFEVVEFDSDDEGFGRGNGGSYYDNHLEVMDSDEE